MAWPHLFRAVGPLFPQCSPHHVTVFLLTFTSYILYHTSRKTFSDVKVYITSHCTPLYSDVSPNGTYFFLNTKQAILPGGTLDTIFLFSYAMGIFINNIIGEWISLQLVMAIGMCSSALVFFCFGTLTNFPHFYNKWFYICLWVLNGLLESTAWPCVVANMDNWFGLTGQGFVFGLWSACASMGNILGACLASLLLQHGYEYTLGYANMELVNYCFLFWLLFYLNSSFGWRESQVSQLSVWYDAEGIVGGTFQGFLTNVVQKRSMLAVCVLLAIGSLVRYSHTPQTKAITALLMSITGLFIGGPSDVMGSAIPDDLGCQEQMKRSREALATVTGIVDRTVSMGTAVGQYLVSLIQDKLGWMWVFYFFVLMTGCTILLISILLLREIRDFVQKRTTQTFRE
ncbi:sugar phosphate exchanger 3-like [Vombatus ursinus]|uniref:sugar phosphate exchanger 3-like n=1 Tax=Vombatus ursinus TaxID=29139 RepID=UPI000FFD12BA|nr:sugar phosphate exchanger 3-like [Vombatus ursinus]